MDSDIEMEMESDNDGEFDDDYDYYNTGKKKCSQSITLADRFN